MKANLYVIVSRAVGEGVAYGLTRAFKHAGTEPPPGAADEIAIAVMNELCEVLVFEDPA